MATNNGNGTPAALTAASAQSNFEQAVVLSLHTWPALTLAVQNSWGGEDSSDKRDWFAGTVVDLFAPFERVLNGVAIHRHQQSTQQQQQTSTSDPIDDAYEEPDTEYVEEFLLQVMADEFDVNVDDDSGYDVAAQIVALRADCAHGRGEALAELRRKWEARRGKKVQATAGKQQGDEDTDGSQDDDDDDNDSADEVERNGSGDGDMQMDEAPQLVSTTPRERPQPEVDDDGFTKVARKR